MLNLKRKMVPQVGRNSPQSHAGEPVSLMDSGGGTSSTTPVKIAITKHKRKKILVATYNIQSMAKDEKLFELEEELTKIKWDIVGLSEIKRRGEQCLDLNSGNRLYYTGNENETYGGVGFLIRKNLIPYITTYKSVSDRVAYIILELPKENKIKLIQVYAPTTTHQDEEVEIFYESLTTAIEEDKVKSTVIMGDFNAKLGQKVENTETKIGKYGYGVRNERGEILNNYLEQQNLYAINTYYKKKANRKWTWRSPDGKTKNEIDYFLCGNKDIFEDVTALNRFTTGSDHRLLRAKIIVRKTKINRNKIIHKSKYVDQEKIRQKGEEYREALKKEFGEKNLQQKCTDINIINEEIKQKLLQSGITVAKKSKIREDRISDETRKLMENRRRLISSGKRNTDEFSELNKRIRKEIKEDLRNYNETKVEKIIEKNRGVKCLRQNLGRSIIISLKDKDGTEVREKNKILKVTQTFYQELYSSNKDPDIITKENLRRKITNVNSEILPNIESYEIEEAISQLKNNRSPGPDGILAEMLKEGKEIILEALKHLFNQCLFKGEIPDDWNESVTVLLYKKGDRADLKNYRPISLLSQTYKLFMRIITNRLTSKLDSYQPVEQAGFRKGYSTADHLLTVRTLIEKANEYHLDLYIGFIDYEKAFDSIELWAIEKAMNNCRIDSRYRMLIHNIYKKATMTVQIGGNTKPIPINRGVRQGDVISPKLFTLALEDVFKNIDWTDNGININGRTLSHLRYADDIIIFATSFEELQTMITQLLRASEEVGLKMNLEKTKIMTNTQDFRQITLNEKKLESVSEYIYLGQIMKVNKENQTAEITRRIRLAWAGFGKLSWILKSSKIQQYLKTRIYDQCILPILTYGSQTWTLTKANMDKITKTQRAMERSMLGVKLRDRKTNEWIRSKTKVKDAGEHAARLKWSFAGHNARLKDKRWNNEIQQWRPWLGKRHRGRPQMRWADDIKKIGGLHWKQMAQNRRRWIELGEAYVQSWIT